VPFTPFHGAIGLACKAVAPRRCSFTVFAATQVAIDLESGFNLLLGRDPVHRFCHTFLGAALVCLSVALVLRLPLERLRGLGWSALPTWWPPPCKLTVRVTLVSSVLGMLGHVIPDAIMHADCQPFAPFVSTNPFLGLVDFETLHLGLITMGVTSIVWIRLVAWRQQRRPRGPDD
jgi:membrane-bound metal-dependent hydrolase YbcI (DUF457 family)